MIVKLHLIMKDQSGNLQDAAISCNLESEHNLETTNGVALMKTVEGIALDTTTLRESSEIFHATLPQRPMHSDECELARQVKPAIISDDYGMSIKLNADKKLLKIYYHGGLIGTVSVKYCPFCGELL